MEKARPLPSELVSWWGAGDNKDSHRTYRVGMSAKEMGEAESQWWGGDNPKCANGQLLSEICRQLECRSWGHGGWCPRPGAHGQEAECWAEWTSQDPREVEEQRGSL